MLSSYIGRRFTSRYVTLTSLISTAYGVQERSLTPHEISGGPKWIDSEHFDVVATASDVPDSPRGTFPSRVLAKLRSLLEDRFRLKTHFESRELLVYALRLARADATLGPKLKPRAIGCISASAAAAEGTSIGPMSRLRICGGRMGPGFIAANGATMDNLAVGVGRFVSGIDRVVVDRTGLTGTFDVELTWKWEGTGEYAGIPPVDRNAPDIFTALREQLGLKLESTKALLSVLVVDHAERPSDD